MMNNQSVSRIIGVECTRGFSRVRVFYVHKRLFLVAIGKVFLAFLVGFLFFSFIEAGASPVGVKRARKVAQNFLLSQHLNGATKGDINLDYVSRELGFRNVHIFQMPDGGGFVIVAGDDCMHPIVGYGTENGEGTNLVVTAAAVSSVAKPMAVRTVCVASADPFEFSSYPRGLFISIK